ncbi:hypothetical protein ACPCIU_11880 [Streptomyces seoulensis]|uniref:hypothetical protein n=1 Tax=Streptomyces seoulensis TaxID=73044 RepID=UPI003C2DACA7
MDDTGVLDEALERLHGAGPERRGRLTNHAPMAVEALAARGQAGGVHRWVGRYAGKLEEFPAGVERGWREVLAVWWPRLLPGMYGGSTHPVIRVGHAVRALLAGETGPRVNELAHGLGYWAARHRPVAGLTPLPGADSAAAALEAVRPIEVRDGGFPARLDRVTGLPVWAAEVTAPEEAHRRLTDLVRAATHRYATHAHGEPTMLVHAATAPNAVLRTLPALPRDLWVPSMRAAWTASAAVTAMYAPDEPAAYDPPGPLTPGELSERALAHGDEHVIKLMDTALDVGDERAYAAALRALELSEPLV